MRKRPQRKLRMNTSAPNLPPCKNGIVGMVCDDGPWIRRFGGDAGSCLLFLLRIERSTLVPRGFSSIVVLCLLTRSEESETSGLYSSHAA